MEQAAPPMTDTTALGVEPHTEQGAPLMADTMSLGDEPHMEQGAPPMADTMAQHFVPLMGSLDPVAAFVKDHMQPGSAAFFAPSPIRRGEVVEATLEIGPPSIRPETLQEELHRLAGRPGVGNHEKIKIAPRMLAELTADQECTILPAGRVEQAVMLGRRTSWKWTVTPQVSGKTHLTATLYAPVILENHESPYLVMPFSKTVEVYVTAPQRFSDWLAWAKEYWVILLAATGGLGTAISWFRRPGRSRP